MRPRILLLLIINVLLIGGTIYLLREWMLSREAQIAQVEAPRPQQETQRFEVLVASRDLPIGTLLRPEHFRWQTWPAEGLSPDYVSRQAGQVPPPPTEGEEPAADGQPRQLTQEDFEGSVVRVAVASGSPITVSAVVNPQDKSFLSAVLPAGMRAVTISISPSSANAGLIIPGDRVDVLLTFRTPIDVDLPDNRRNRWVTETVMRDVLLIALDQRLGANREEPFVPRTATLQVTPKQAEAVTLLENFGSLSLTLRSLQPSEKPEPPVSMTWDFDTVDALINPIIDLQATPEPVAEPVEQVVEVPAPAPAPPQPRRIPRELMILRGSGS